MVEWRAEGAGHLAAAFPFAVPLSLHLATRFFDKLTTKLTTKLFPAHALPHPHTFHFPPFANRVRGGIAFAARISYIDPMSDIPPKQPVEGKAAAPMPGAAGRLREHDGYAPDIDSSGALVSLHNAALQSGSDSFPVLKAFQDYLESERRRARRRVALVSVLFTVILVVVLIALLTAGLMMFRYMRETQENLWRRLESQSTPPPAAASAADGALAAQIEKLGSGMEDLRRDNAALRERLTAPPAAPPAPASPTTSAAAPTAPATTVAPATTAAPAAASPAAPATAPSASAAAIAAAPTAGPAAAPATASAESTEGAPAAAPAAAPGAAAVSAAPAAALATPGPGPAPLVVPEGVEPPPPPAGHSESTIALPPADGQGRPVPWRLFLPAP